MIKTKGRGREICLFCVERKAPTMITEIHSPVEMRCNHMITCNHRQEHSTQKGDALP